MSLSDTPSFKHKAYAALKNAIIAMDVYRSRDDIRLDERKLAHDFGISRTPVREAMAQLESEGFVRSVPRRGIYVVRKTKREVIEMITVWAALESMAARLMTEVATQEEIAGLRRMFTTFDRVEQCCIEGVLAAFCSYHPMVGEYCSGRATDRRTRSGGREATAQQQRLRIRLGARRRLWGFCSRDDWGGPAGWVS